MRKQRRMATIVGCTIVLGFTMACLSSSGIGRVPVPDGATKLDLDQSAIEDIENEMLGGDETVDEYDIEVEGYELDTDFGCSEFEDTYDPYLEDLEDDGYESESMGCFAGNGLIAAYQGDEDEPDVAVLVIFSEDGDIVADAFGIDGVDGGFLLIMFVEKH